MLTFADVFEALTGVRLPEASLIISEASINSRQAIPASLFFAFPGERVDGHDFIEDAFRHGAQAAVIQKDVPGSYPIVDLRGEPPSPGFSLARTALLAAGRRHSDPGPAAHRPLLAAQAELRVIGITGSVGKSTTKELIAEVLSQRYHTLKTRATSTMKLACR